MPVMSSGNCWVYTFLSLLSLWLLSRLNSPSLDYLVSISMAMAKYSGTGTSTMDVLYGFSGFLLTKYSVRLLSRGKGIQLPTLATRATVRGKIKRRLTIIVTTPVHLFTAYTTLAIRLLGNALQVLLNARDFATSLAQHCALAGEVDFFIPPIDFSHVSLEERPSWYDVGLSVFYAVAIRECLPSMLGSFMSSSAIRSWVCDAAGLVALVVSLVPSLVLNAVSSVSLQEAGEISLQEDLTLVQTPSPSLKKKYLYIVDRLRTPPRGRLPNTPSPPRRSPNVSAENSIVGSPSAIARQVSFSAHGDEIDSFASGPHSVIPEIIEDASLANDTFSLTDALAVTAEDNLLGEQSDIGMILDDMSDDDDETDFCLPEELTGHVFTRSVNPKVPEERTAEVCANESPVTPLVEVYVPFPPALMMNLADKDVFSSPNVSVNIPRIESIGANDTFSLSDVLVSGGVQENLVDVGNTCNGLADVSMGDMYSDSPVPRFTGNNPCITLNACKESHGANDTFSITDVLVSAGTQDNLVDVRDTCGDLADVSMGDIYSDSPVPPFIGKIGSISDVCKAPVSVEECVVPVPGPSTHEDVIVVEEPAPGPRKSKQRKILGLNDDAPKEIYTAYGSIPLVKIPYELFSPASMRASEVASELLPEEGRVRCAEWRADVEQGQLILQAERMIEQNEKDAAEAYEAQAKLKSLMREQGMDVPVTPPRVSIQIPQVTISPASPERGPAMPVLGPSKVLTMAYRFPAFLDEAAPITIDTRVAPSGLVVSESVDSMFDPEFPGLDGKQADKYPKLDSNWPVDFPTEADTSDEWKLTQEMIDSWTAYKARKEAENPTPPIDMDAVSAMSNQCGEKDRSLSDFDVIGEFEGEEEKCVPGNSKLRCLGWRYEVVEPEPPKPPQPRQPTLIDIIGGALLEEMKAIKAAYGGEEEEPEPVETAPRAPSPSVTPLPAPVVEPAAEPAPPSKAPKKSTAPRPSTSTAAPTTRVLRPRPSAPAKLNPAPAPSKTVKAPRASITTATIAPRAPAPKKAAPRKSLPVTRAPVPRQSLALPKAAPKQAAAPPKAPRQSLPVLEPKAVPRQSLATLAPPKAPRHSLATIAPKAAPRQSLVAPRQSLATLAPKVATAAPKAAARQSLAAPRQSLATIAPKAALKQSLPAPKAPLKSITKPTVAAPLRAPLGTVQTNVPRTSLPAPAIAPAPKSKLVAPKRLSLASTAAPVAAAPKALPRPSLSRLPAPRTAYAR
ncbi:hypothetical protein DXG01_001702 [Tephrocybe rancida]|nr:hypothetical protein DXG01_001702 [Tephrocybe rancida]